MIGNFYLKLSVVLCIYNFENSITVQFMTEKKLLVISDVGLINYLVFLNFKSCGFMSEPFKLNSTNILRIPPIFLTLCISSGAYFPIALLRLYISAFTLKSWTHFTAPRLTSLLPSSANAC
jgi:hypothetical protein